MRIFKKDLSVPVERLYDVNERGRQMKMYEVKEIEEYTGLSRKDLFVYEESIPPVKRKDNAGSNAKGGERKGYKLYDQEGLEKLCMAVLFKKLGATPKRINELFAEGNFDKNDVFDELILEAGRKRQEADDIITVANVLKELNMEAVSQSFFQLSNLHGLAEQLRRELNSDETKKVIEKWDKPTEEELIEIYRGFDGYTEADLESDKVEAQVEKLKRFAVEVLDVDGGRFLSGQANSLVAVDAYAKDIEKRTRRGLPEFIADAIFAYQINHFWDEGENVVEDLEKCIGMDYSEKRVKAELEKFMMLLNRWFGYRNYAEGENIISKLKLQFKKDGDMEDEVKLMDYICGAMKYYGDVR